MKSIGGHRQAALQITQPSSLRLTVGQPVQARVLGPTRHGLSVAIGQETFQLHAPSRLADAGTLTLQGTASSSASGQPISAPGQQVTILAQDDRSLSRPIEARLVADTQNSKPSVSAIVQKSAIKVAASPVSPDGTVLGPRITLHLQTQPPEAADSTTLEKVKSVSGQRPQAVASSAHQGPADVVRSGGLPPPSAHQSEASGVDDRGLEAPIRKPLLISEEQIQKIVSPLTSSGTSFGSAGSAGSTPFIRERSTGAVQSRGDHPKQQSVVAGSILSSGREPAPPRSTVMSAGMVYREEAVIETKAVLRKPHSGELLTTAGRHETVTASVVGRTSTGNVLVEAGGRLMRIEQPVDLPVGTTLQVTFASSMSAWATPINRPAPENSATLLNRLVGLLDAIDQTAGQTAEVGQQALKRRLPAPDRHLASRFLGLLVPDAGGQPLEGEASSSPERRGMVSTQGEQMKALVRELGSMASESLTDGWKGLTLPLGSDQNQAVSLYFRGHDLDPDDEAPESDAEDKKTQRAVFDVSFSQIGRCQVDVLCQERRFDLLVRSEVPFEPEDRQDVAAIFISACEIAGMKGEIGFNVGSFFEPARSSSAATELRT